MSPQDSYAHGVKGRNPYLVCPEAHQSVHAFPHLSRSLVCKSNGQNIPGLHPHLIYHIRNPVSQASGLTAARTRKNKKGTVCVQHALLLLFIQSVIYTHCYPSSTSLKFHILVLNSRIGLPQYIHVFAPSLGRGPPQFGQFIASPISSAFSSRPTSCM